MTDSTGAIVVPGKPEDTGQRKSLASLLCQLFRKPAGVAVFAGFMGLGAFAAFPFCVLTSGTAKLNGGHLVSSKTGNRYLLIKRVVSWNRVQLTPASSASATTLPDPWAQVEAAFKTNPTLMLQQLEAEADIADDGLTFSSEYVSGRHRATMVYVHNPTGFSAVGNCEVQLSGHSGVIWLDAVWWSDSNGELVETAEDGVAFLGDRLKLLVDQALKTKVFQGQLERGQ